MKRILLAVFCAGLTGCTVSEDDSHRILRQEGLSDVHLTGVAFFGCGKDDEFSMGFQGRKNGVPVEGVLCSGWFKGITVRYK